MAIGSVGVTVVPDAENWWRDFEAKTRPGATETGRRLGRDLRAGMQSELDRPVRVRAEADTAPARAQLAALRSEGDKSGGGLLKALLPLAPALAPLAAAAGVAGAGLVAMGATGILAVTGLKNELKDVTPQGVQVNQIVRTLHGSLAGLQGTARAGFLPGFEQAVGKLRTDIPQVNRDITQQGRLLGDITSHLAGGLVGGLRNFGPALNEVTGSVDKVAAHFESWATGPGGAKFARTLISDYHQVAPVIADLGHLVETVLRDSNTFGLGIVQGIDLIARAANSLPDWLISGGIAAFAVTKLAGTVNSVLNLSKSYDVFTAKREASAAAATAADLRQQASAAESAAAIARAQAAEAESVVAAQRTIVAALEGTDSILLASAQTALVASEEEAAAMQAAAAAAVASSEEIAAAAEAAAATSDAAGAAAAGGWSAALGPIGLVAGGLLLLTTAFGNDSQAAQQDTQTVNSFTQALVNSKNAINDSVRAAVVKKASDDGLLESARLLNVSQSDLVTAITGTDQQYQALYGSLTKTNTAAQLTGAFLDKLFGEKPGKNALALADALAHQRDLFKQARQAAADQEAALEGAASGNTTLAKAISDGNTALRAWVVAEGVFNKSADTGADRATLLGEALRAANGDALAYAQTIVSTATANQQFVTDLKNVAKGVVDLKTGTIDYHNAAAAPLINDLQAIQDANVKAAAAVYQHELATKGGKKAADDAFDTYTTNTRGQLIDEAERLGYSAKAAAGLANQFLSIKNSGDLKKQIELLGGDKVQQALDGILADLDILAGRTHVVFVKADTGDALGKILNLGSAIGSALNRNFDIQVHVQESRTGGSVGAGLAGALKKTSTTTTSTGEGGFTGVDYSGGKTGSGSGASSAAQSALGTALGNFLASPSSGAAAVSKAFQAILTAASRDKKPIHNPLLTELKTENKDLIGIVTERTSIAAKLTAAQQKLANAQQAYTQEASTVSSAITGTFQITQVHSVYNDRQVGITDILSQVKTAVANASRFTTIMKRLVKEGLARTLIQQLAEAGPAALPQAEALLSATPAQFAQVNASYKQLASIGATFGKYAANDLYEAGIQSAKGLIAGLKSQESELAKTIKHLADTMVAQIKKDLGIKSPSTVMHGLGRHTVEGLVSGMVSQMPAVKDVANRMAMATQFATDPESAGRGSAQGGRKPEYHIHGVDDPHAFATAVMRREAFLAGGV